MSQPRNEGFVRLPKRACEAAGVPTPAGFEKFFADLAELMSQMPPGPPDKSRIGAIYGTY